MGSRHYAERVAILLDPKDEYFKKSRIISRDDLKQKRIKTLDLVLGEERGVIILDDNESLWNEHNKNLIVMGEYDYFRDKTFNYNSLPEKRSDETETNGVLANVLGVLIKIHGLFFKDPTNLGCQDVRTLLRKIRTQILWGYTLFFKDVEDDVAVVWSRAEAMGATCKTLMDTFGNIKQNDGGFSMGRTSRQQILGPSSVDQCCVLFMAQTT